MADKEGQPPSPRPNTILLIEDDERVRTLTQFILQDSGFQVQSASMGQQGLDLFHANLTSIVAAVIDMSLPDMDGLVICRLLRQQCCRLPIVLMSGNPDPGLGSEYGPTFFLQKPFHITEFLNSIQKMVTEEVQDCAVAERLYPS